MMRLTLMLVASLMYSQTSAAETIYDFGGFVSQNYIVTTDNKFYGDTDESAGDFGVSELGLRGSAVFTDSGLSLSGQALFREAGELASSESELDYLLLGYDLINNEEVTWAVEAGRSKYELAMYNSSREIPGIATGIILPQSIYYDRARNLLRYNDGVGTRLQIRQPGITDEFFYWHATAINEKGDDIEAYLLLQPQEGEFEFDRGYQAYWKRQYQHGLSLHLSYGEAILDYQPGDVDFLESGQSKTSATTYSVLYDTADYQLSAEYLYGVGESTDYGVFLPDNETDFEGLTIQYTAYETGYEWFARVDHFDTVDKEAFLALGYPTDALYARDYTIGGRWHLNSQLSFAAEYHNIEGTGWLSYIENPDINARVKYWDMVVLGVAYTF